MESSAAPCDIVVGVDGSDEAHHALAWAVGEAARRGASLEVVHAWSTPAPVSEIAAMTAEFDDEVFEKLADEVLGEALALVADTTSVTRIESSAVRGYPSSVLLDRASAADLLVVGSRGRGGIADLLLGSVSHQCVHHATRPVAVIPRSAPVLEDGQASGEVVVGVDGSPESQGALTWAFAEAAWRDAHLVVLHAWGAPFAVPLGGVAPPPVPWQDFSAESTGMLRELVARVATDAARTPRDVELLAIEDRPVPALLSRAKTADLLVVGNRGRGGFASLLLGSVSLQCLHHATSAVVIVPHSISATE